MGIPIIQSKIHTLRGQRVILDFDLAALYEVEARVLNQSVKRNLRRFPEDFMFQLSMEEWEKLRLELAESPNMSSQFVMTYSNKRALRYMPFAFSERKIKRARMKLQDYRSHQRTGKRDAPSGSKKKNY